MHDITLESVAAVTNHFANAFVRENVSYVYMTLWRRNDVRKFDYDAILFLEIKCKERDIIGITHVFSCINICRVPRMLFEHEADRDPAIVNAMKQTCVIVILAYFTLFQPNSHRKRCENSKLFIFYTGFFS